MRAVHLYSAHIITRDGDVSDHFQKRITVFVANKEKKTWKKKIKKDWSSGKID